MLNAYKISQNVSKTELVIFKRKKKSPNVNLRIKFNGKRLYPTDSVKHLGINDVKLRWKIQCDEIAIKLNRENALLFKVRDFVNTDNLNSI